MADPLYELLTPYLGSSSPSRTQPPVPYPDDSTTSNYLNRLTTLSHSALTTTEPASLAQSTHSVLRSLQALSKRSHRSVIAASDHLAHLSSLLPSLGTQASNLKDGLPTVENAASRFAQKYDRSTENAVLDRRKRAMLLTRNVDRIGDILDLPTLLSSAISASSTNIHTSGGASTIGYASALDLHAHVKRLNTLYPGSELVGDISRQAEEEVQNLVTVLITGLQSQNLKLASAMRMVGWLRRVSPELVDHYSPAHLGYPTNRATPGRTTDFLAHGTGEGALGAAFLVCRLNTLRRMLEALEPLKELADQETARRRTLESNQGQNGKRQERWTGGTQTERYLKRYIEIFREQSFAIISMYKSIFPTALPVPGSVSANADSTLSLAPASTQTSSALDSNRKDEDVLEQTPSALATFAPRLVQMLTDTLLVYMPNVTERTSRDSLLTQVLYCAGSLGRLGADFGMMLSLLEEDSMVDKESDEESDDPEWVQVMKKHRVQASRLELLASGVASGRKGSTSQKARQPSTATSAG
ncbi:hypothetical protein H2203_000337 [Taxawa tesnikishii (nom. ined.)]|nr:hypothetical protein H2203_000337 [Dothideales sp. JES 119]